MLEKEILDIREESKSFSNSTVSLLLSDVEEFLNLMKGLEILYLAMSLVVIIMPF